MISGQFKNNDGKLYTVFIKKNGDNTEKVIGEDGLFFADNPIEIETSIEDTFTPIIKRSLTLNLISTEYLGNYFFGVNERDVTINVFDENDNCIFAGYVEPNIYTQPYAEHFDSIQINCIDYLSILQYDYLTDGTNYEYVKTNANLRSFYYFINKFGLTNTNLDLTNTVQSKVYFDKSKYYTIPNVFNEAAISEIVFLGESEDDLLTNEEILFEILQFLNLHIVQIGFNFYIFDWDTLKQKNTINWLNISDNTTTNTTVSTVNIEATDYCTDGTNISMAEVYNQIQVKDEISSVEDIITSPLDSDSLNSFYTNKQPYMTEIASDGSGDDANEAFNDVVDGRASNYDGLHIFEWFMQVMDNPNWKLYLDNGQTELNTIYQKDNNGVYKNQHLVTKYLAEHPLTPAILRFGSVEKKSRVQDDSPINKIDMDDYLVISVNGNEVDTEGSQSPTDADILAHKGMIEYTNSVGGLVFSPTDEKSTNYLVFSGRLLLQPIVYESSTTIAQRRNSFYDILNGYAPKSEGADANVPQYTPIPSGGIIDFHNNLVTSDGNDEGRYYTRKFYTAVYPKDVVNPDTDYLKDGSMNFQPFIKDKSAHGYEYNYSAVGASEDRFKKLPILECELIIGNKRLVETNIDEEGNSTFQWYELGNEPVIDGVTKTTFSLGVNPKIGDFIIGDEFDLQNTIDYTMGIDAEGTAIPIKKSDNISGTVTFRILGPVNLLWNDITRRHPSFWRHTSWSESSKFVLAHTQNIIIKDFECKIYTDNGGNEVNTDNDLIYVSDEVFSNIKKKDDITFKINTALGTDEAYDLGITNTVNLSSVVSSLNNNQLMNLTNTVTSDTAKAEQLYCDAYFREYSQPKLILETDIHNTNKVSNWNRYTVNYFNKTFFPIGINYNLMNNSVHLTLKEI